VTWCPLISSVQQPGFKGAIDEPLGDIPLTDTSDTDSPKQGSRCGCATVRGEGVRNYFLHIEL